MPCVRALVLSSLLAAPTAASIANPASGFHFELVLGKSATIKLDNAMGCEFSDTAETDHPEFLDVSRGLPRTRRSTTAGCS